MIASEPTVSERAQDRSGVHQVQGMFHRSVDQPPHRNPGILALTASLEPLYYNSEAQELSRQLSGHDTALGPAALPKDVLALCQDILARLKVSLDCKDVEQVQVRRVAGVSKLVLLQGFSIPTSHTVGSSLIIILMEALTTETPLDIQKAQAGFNLTDREMHVAEHLARGLTNKEIAFTLHITEQTVKQHVKHMMLKTQSTTRTGLLAQLLGVSHRTSEHERQSHRLRHVS
jgi:DNA-binding CsgD family transcriptional regulator